MNMKSILWVQTKEETGSDDVVSNYQKGNAKDYDELLHLQNKTMWTQLTPEPYNVKVSNDDWLVRGHVEEKDYLNSNLPFVFFCQASDVKETFASLEKSLGTLNYSLNKEKIEETCRYVNNSNIESQGDDLKMKSMELLLSKLEELVRSRPKFIVGVVVVMIILLLTIIKQFGSNN